jgi:hypothetical protein
VFIAEGVRHKFADVFADEFLARVTEHALGGGVNAADDAALVNSNDRIERRVQDRPQPLFSIANGLLDLFALDDIAVEGNKVSTTTLRIEQWSNEQLGIVGGTVFAIVG